MKRIFVPIFLLTTMLGGCATHKEWAATGGSRSDGIVRLSYEQHELEQPILNEQQAINIATKRCNSWGYSGAEAFGGVTRTCNQWGGIGGCARFLVTKDYQCINATESVAITNLPTSYPATTATLTSIQPVTLGVQYISVTKQLSDSLRMKTPGGVYVVAVVPDSAAEKSGIQQGDIILRIGDHNVKVLDDIPISLSKILPKSKIPVSIWREGNEKLLFVTFN